MNFDGVGKGNPSMTGMGGVIRDSDNNITQLYTGSIGKSTKNAVEFRALEIDL
jgi:ribonuclease HI